jgi:prepilin-type N-terminal cleavage/methylation domain-containing protein
MMAERLSPELLEKGVCRTEAGRGLRMVEWSSRAMADRSSGSGPQTVRGSRGFTAVEIMIVVLIIGLLAALVVPSFIRARADAQKNVCIDNLRVIEGAKEQWALLYEKAQGAIVNDDEVNSLLKKGARPECPADGTYTYGVVGASPECSLAGEKGHALP